MRVRPSTICQLAVFLVAIFGIELGSAIADPVTFNFSGTVTQVTLYGSDPFAGTVVPGTSFAGTYTFDSIAPPDIDVMPETAYYDFRPRPSPFTMIIGGNRIDSSLDFIRVIDNLFEGAAYTDVYQAFGSGAIDGQLFIGGVTLSKRAAATPAAIAATALPIVPPQIRDFSSYVFSYHQSGRIFITGTLESLTSAESPVANAGVDKRVNEAEVVRLDGSGSTGSGLSFQWTQVAGPPVVLDDATAAVATFTAPLLAGGLGTQTLTFQLTVRTNLGTSSDSVDVVVGNVNHAPVADAGPSPTVNEASLVTLDGRASFDQDGDQLDYQWRQTAGTPVTLVGMDTATPSFIAPTLPRGTGGSMTLTFVLTVSDGLLSHSDDVSIVAEPVNHPPVASAGTAQTVQSGRMVSLDGNASSDPDSDPIVFQWGQIAGPPVELMNATTATPSFIAPPTSGPIALAFRLIVSDRQLTSVPEDVVVTVVNDGPMCELARAVPELLWPPDHRMAPIAITGVTDPNNDTVVIEITGVRQDEPVNGRGSGQTSPDAVISNGLLLRAERSGKGGGRVYHVSFTAHDGVGAQCTGEFRVVVPRDMKTTVVDNGPVYDSTRPVGAPSPHKKRIKERGRSHCAESQRR